jgi:hypothetical protein
MSLWRFSEAQAQGGQRRAQLVGSVGDEGALGGQQLVEPMRHRRHRLAE